MWRRIDRAFEINKCSDFKQDSRLNLSLGAKLNIERYHYKLVAAVRDIVTVATALMWVCVCVCELLRCHLDSLHCGKAVSRPFVAPLYVNRCHRGQPPPRVGSTGRTIPVIPMMWRDVTWGDMTWWSSVDLIELGFVDLIGPKFCRKIMQTTELSMLSHKVRVPFMWKVFCILSVGTHFTNLILGECFHQHYSKTNLSQAAPNFNKKRSW